MFLRFLRPQRLQMNSHKPRYDPKMQSTRPVTDHSKTTKFGKKQQKKRNEQSSALTKWPSDSHNVICFTHADKDLVDVNALTKNLGTIKNKEVLRNRSDLFVTKVEMSNSDEAKQIWKKFNAEPPLGIISVEPDMLKRLNSKKNNHSNQAQNQVTRKPQFEEYLSDAEIKEGIKNGKIVCGRIRINSKKFTHAFISDENGRDILIDGLKDRNRALEGDQIAVMIKNESEWVMGAQFKRPAATDSSTKSAADNLKKLTINTNDSQTNSNQSQFKHSRKTGKVVAILEYRNSRCTTGHIKINGVKNMKPSMVFFSPLLSIFPRLFLPRSSFKDQLSNPDLSKILFVAKMKDWSVYENIPVGELCDILGQQGEIEAETRRILIDHNIDAEEFPQEAFDCLPSDMSTVLSAEETVKRRDFTNECIFSIDPATAKDLDDALHCKPLPDGNFEVGVHIADVSHFVKASTIVDEIASKRCTSVYLVQKVIPMLPNVLCEDLCSLNPGTKRLAFSVVWTMTEKGKIVSEWFGKSIICSCAKLSYDHAQSFINDPTRNFQDPETSPKEDEFPDITGGYNLSEIRAKVLDLYHISRHLKKQRFNNGALRLDQVRLSYTLNNDWMPTGCYAFERKESNELIEEFMLLANMAVARKIYKTMPTLAFLRSHPSPKETMMEDFVDHCKSTGLDIDAESSASLSRSIDTACGNDALAKYRKQALFYFAIKPQQLATYICAGSQKDPSYYHHYALNVPLYTHFTSPIRRYADIIVHRQLAVVLRLEGAEEQAAATSDDLQRQAELCNDHKYNAKIAGEVSVELFFSLLVSNYGPLESKGMVMYVNDRSVDVLSTEYGVVKRVYVDAIPGVSFKYEEKTLDTGLKTGSLRLKWLKDSTESERKSSDPPIPYDDQAPGIVQTLHIFSVVKMLLKHQEPDPIISIRAALVKPSPQEYQTAM